MRLPVPPTISSPDALAASLRAAFPGYTVTMRAGVPIVGDGLATGVMLKADGPGYVKTAWAFPSIAAQLVVTLTILAGILPGLLLFLIVWLVTKGGVARMEQEIATVLAGGPAPQQQAASAGGAGGSAPPPPSPGTFAIAGGSFLHAFTGLIAILGFGRAGAIGLISWLFWVGLGVAALLVHGDETRAETDHRAGRPSSPPGPGRLIAGVCALLLSLSWLMGLFRGDIDFWFFESLFSMGVWIYAGVGLLVGAKNGTRTGAGWLLVAGESTLMGFSSLINAVMLLGNSHVPAILVLRVVIGAFADFAIAAGILLRFMAHRGTVAAPAGAGFAPAGGFAPPGGFAAPGGFAPPGGLAPAAGAPWRADPDLAGRFQPQYPDDLQVLLHDGEPRRTQRTPEACWVHIEAIDGTLRFANLPPNGPMPPAPQTARWIERRIYRGKLLNQPYGLTETRQHADVLFVHAPGIPHPVQVRIDYLRERPSWGVVPCDRCGADQALDPPTVMARTRFPNAPAGAVPVAFTAFCPCGGTMTLVALPPAPR